MTFSHGCCNVLDKKAHFDDKLLLVDFQHNYIYLYTFKDGAFMGFHCHYICHSNDVLYYVHHTLKLYDLSIQDTPIQLCGLIDLNSPYYITLNSYCAYLSFYHDNITDFVLPQDNQSVYISALLIT